MKGTLPYDVYIAAPFFSEQQITRLSIIERACGMSNIRFYSPMRECVCPPDASPIQRMQVFEDNLEAIRGSFVTVCCTDDKDLGTLFEAGYAYRLQRPIVYCAFTLGRGQFNLMLSESSFRVFTDVSKFTCFMTDELGPALKKLKQELPHCTPAVSLPHLINMLGKQDYQGDIE